MRCAVAPADEADALAVISKWPSKLNGHPVDPRTFAVEACDTHWLLGKQKAVAAGLGGSEMAKYFPVNRESLHVHHFSCCSAIDLQSHQMLFSPQSNWSRLGAA